MKKKNHPEGKKSNILVLKRQLQSARLFGASTMLKPFKKNDITKKYVRWLNDPKTTRYSDQRFLKHSFASCQKYLNTFKKSPNLFLKIVSRRNQQTVGTMTAYVSVPHKTVDIGILIGERDIWGQGYGSDAWNTFLNWLLKKAKVRKVTAGTVKSNSAMVRIFKKSGMIREGIQRQQVLLGGKPEDLIFYGKFRKNHL